MSQKELGHPNTVLLRNEWIRHKDMVKRQEQKRKRSDKMGRVKSEDISQTTILGMR